MALEKWQRYTKSKPCEICGGYSTSKPKCKGFRHRDGTGNYCQQIKSSQELNVHGLMLYWHGNLYDASGNMPEGASGRSSPGSNADAERDSLGSRAPSEMFIAEEVVEYPARGRWRPAETKKWFVVYRDGVELTRDLRREVAERYLT